MVVVPAGADGWRQPMLPSLGLVAVVVGVADVVVGAAPGVVVEVALPPQAPAIIATAIGPAIHQGRVGRVGRCRPS
ncbi:MAG: hypothetical protein ABSF33_10460 [Acidimicrobiales bacterium]